MTNRTRFSGSRGAARGGGGGVVSCGNGSSARDGSTEDGSVTMLSRGVASVTPPAVSLSTVPAAAFSPSSAAKVLTGGKRRSTAKRQAKIERPDIGFSRAVPARRNLSPGKLLQQFPSRCQGLAGGFLVANARDLRPLAADSARRNFPGTFLIHLRDAGEECPRPTLRGIPRYAPWHREPRTDMLIIYKA